MGGFPSEVAIGGVYFPPLLAGMLAVAAAPVTASIGTYVIPA